MRRIRGCGKDGSCNHSFAGSTIISSLWKIFVWSIEHNHYLPVKSSRVQPQLFSTTLFSPTLFSLTFWLISNPSPGLSSLLSEPLLSHLLVDLQPFSGNLLSDDIRTIPSSSQTRDVCDQSSAVITSDFVVLSSNSSGRVLVTLVLVKQLTVKRTLSESSQTRAP